jgi:hypothetical protein
MSARPVAGAPGADLKALQVVNDALPHVLPFAGPIVDAVLRAQRAVAEAESSGADSLRHEAAKQQIVMDLQANTARVAQELAIAERMASAEEIEIEEYFEGSGKGVVGLNVEKGVVAAGLNGEGQRITKRVIRLRGFGTSRGASEGE